MAEATLDAFKKVVIQKGPKKGFIRNPLTAQEEANTILKSVNRKPTSEGYRIDKKAREALENRARDYLLTAQADNTVQSERSAKRDPLTDLWNRVAMTEEIQRAIGEVGRKGGGIHLIFMDLRGFKGYNDTYGHLVGDKALLALVDGIQKHIRPYDVLARMGGEEFAILLKNGSADVAQTISDRLHDTLRVLPSPFNEIRADMGMASFAREDANSVSVEQLVDRADRAMYFAKKNDLKSVKEWEPSLGAVDMPKLS